MTQPLTYMERIAALERRVAELERVVRALVPPTQIPAILLKAAPPLMPMPQMTSLDALRYPEEKADGDSR